MPTELVAVPITPVTLALATTVMSQPPPAGTPVIVPLTMVAPANVVVLTEQPAAPPTVAVPSENVGVINTGKVSGERSGTVHASTVADADDGKWSAPRPRRAGLWW